MTSGSANYNLIQANINMDGTKALKFEVDGSGYVTAAGGANIVAKLQSHLLSHQN